MTHEQKVRRYIKEYYELYPELEFATVDEKVREFYVVAWQTRFYDRMEDRESYVFHYDRLDEWPWWYDVYELDDNPDFDIEELRQAIVMDYFDHVDKEYDGDGKEFPADDLNTWSNGVVEEYIRERMKFLVEEITQKEVDDFYERAKAPATAEGVKEKVAAVQSDVELILEFVHRIDKLVVPEHKTHYDQLWDTLCEDPEFVKLAFDKNKCKPKPTNLMPIIGLMTGRDCKYKWTRSTQQKVEKAVGYTRSYLSPGKHISEHAEKLLEKAKAIIEEIDEYRQ